MPDPLLKVWSFPMTQWLLRSVVAPFVVIVLLLWPLRIPQVVYRAGLAARQQDVQAQIKLATDRLAALEQRLQAIQALPKEQQAAEAAKIQAEVDALKKKPEAGK